MTEEENARRRQIEKLEKRVRRLEEARDTEKPEPPFSKTILLTADEKRFMTSKQIAYYEGGPDDD